MILESGEGMVAQGEAEAAFGDGHSSGVLYLTNHRLVYEEHIPGGWFHTGSVQTLVDVPLKAIRNAGTVETTFGKLRLHLEFFPPYPQSIQFRISDAERWRSTIVRVRAEAPSLRSSPPSDGRTAKEQVPAVIVNVASAVPPPPVVMFPCPFCKRPQPSHLVKCSNCGAPLRG